MGAGILAIWFTLVSAAPPYGATLTCTAHQLVLEIVRYGHDDTASDGLL